MLKKQSELQPMKRDLHVHGMHAGRDATRDYEDERNHGAFADAELAKYLIGKVKTVSSTPPTVSPTTVSPTHSPTEHAAGTPLAPPTATAVASPPPVPTSVASFVASSTFQPAAGADEVHPGRGLHPHDVRRLLAGHQQQRAFASLVLIDLSLLSGGLLQRPPCTLLRS